MITTKLKHISKEDTVVMYAFEMLVETNEEELETIEDLEQIMVGGTDEQSNNFYALTPVEQTKCVRLINKLLDVYHGKSDRLELM